MKRMQALPRQCSCIESVFFFELPQNCSTDVNNGSNSKVTDGKRHHGNIVGAACHTGQDRPSNNSASDDWLVKSLYERVCSGMRDRCSFEDTKLTTTFQLATMSIDADQQQPLCRFLIAHRTKVITCDADLEEELQQLNKRSHKHLMPERHCLTEILGTKMKPQPLRPLGGVVALLGPRFASTRGTEYLVCPPDWEPEDRWLWMMTDCPPLEEEGGQHHLQQRDVPGAHRSDLFFDIAGRKACVGRYATVLIDTRTLDFTDTLALDTDGLHPLPSVMEYLAAAPLITGPTLQWHLLHNYVHRWLTESMMVAMTQREHLYRLSSELLEPDVQDEFAGFLKKVSDFRRTFWWEHLCRHPTAVAFSRFQQYFRLPSLMAQLSAEGADYHQQQRQQLDARLNDLVTFLALISVVLGLLQVSSLHGFDPIYLFVALAFIAAAALVVAIRVRLRTSNGSIFRRQRSGGST